MAPPDFKVLKSQLAERIEHLSVVHKGLSGPLRGTLAMDLEYSKSLCDRIDLLNFRTVPVEEWSSVLMVNSAMDLRCPEGLARLCEIQLSKLDNYDALRSRTKLKDLWFHTDTPLLEVTGLELESVFRLTVHGNERLAVTRDGVFRDLIGFLIATLEGRGMLCVTRMRYLAELEPPWLLGKLEFDETATDLAFCFKPGSRMLSCFVSSDIGAFVLLAFHSLVDREVVRAAFRDERMPDGNELAFRCEIAEEPDSFSLVCTGPKELLTALVDEIRTQFNGFL